MAASLNVVIAGGTGMIGRALVAELFSLGHHITVLTRGQGGSNKVARARAVQWNPGVGELDLDALGQVDVVINLAGASLAKMPWTPRRKRNILESRIAATNEIVDAIAHAKVKPSVLINASAVGIYGDQGSEALAETAPEGTGFLADVCRAWEAAAREVDPAVRLVIARTGIVIGPEGALTPLRRVASLSLAGPFGGGKQWWPWISLRDEVRAFVHVMNNRAISGPVNFVAPEPATARMVVRALARRLHRAYWLPTPKFALRALLGEAANEMLLASQKVVPTHLTASGFEFDDPRIERAIARAILEVDREKKYARRGGRVIR